MLLLPNPGAHKQPDCSSSAPPGPPRGELEFPFSVRLCRQCSHRTSVHTQDTALGHTNTGNSLLPAPFLLTTGKARRWEVQAHLQCPPLPLLGWHTQPGQELPWISASLTDRRQTDTHLPSCPHSPFPLHGNQAPSALRWVLKGMFRTDAHRASAQPKHQELKKPQ